MRKTKVGIVTFSDGRDYIHQSLEELNWRYQRKLAAALEATGEVEVVPAEEIVWNNESANRQGRHLAAAGCDLTILNYAIWCYPHLSALVTRFAPGPFLLFGNLHPSEPGMVGMLAAAGALDQLGAKFQRVWGDADDPAVLARIMSFIRAAGALAKLRGQTFGLFGATESELEAIFGWEGGRMASLYTRQANRERLSKQAAGKLLNEQEMNAYSRTVLTAARTPKKQ